MTPDDNTDPGVGSDRWDADLSTCHPLNPSKPGEESVAESAGSVFRQRDRADTWEKDGYDSTDDRDDHDRASDCDHGDRYVWRPGDRSGHRQYMSSTDGEDKTWQSERDQRFLFQTFGF